MGFVTCFVLFVSIYFFKEIALIKCFSFLFFLFFFFFFFLTLLSVLDLCCTGFSLVVAIWGNSPVAVRWLLIAVAPLVEEQQSSCA